MATATTSEWTEEKCLHLIREYRARPALWDTKNPYYFKKTLKPMAWNAISEAIGVAPDRCRHKMFVLMSSFRREKSKIRRSLRREQDESMVYNSTWFAFKEMSFLMDKEKERKRQREGIEDDDESPHTSMALLKKLIDPPMPPPLKRMKQSKLDNRDYAVLSTRAIEEELPEPRTIPLQSPSQTTSERNEEISSFTTFIGMKMKKYSDTTKNAVQQAICDIIFKADQNYYERENLTIIDDESDPLDRTLYETQNGTIKLQTYSDSSN